MRLLPFLIAGVVTLLLAMVAVLFFVVLPKPGPTAKDTGSDDQFLGYIDSEARIEIETLQEGVEGLRGDIENLQVRIATLEAALSLSSALA